ncbi:site-specific DNA-methyltransferase [Sulfitobacter sp. AS92]|uniref:DNA-methyltransferase n=1 Tax=Sulfitobacter sp. AS92 TaxID=3135783 RepID=UPI00317C9D8D
MTPSRCYERVEPTTVALAEMGAECRVQIGPCTLYLGDALDILPSLRGQADLVVTDPPYKLTSGGNTSGAMGGKMASEVYDNTGLLMDVVKWQEIGGPIYRALGPNGDAYVMCEDKNLFAAHGGFLGAGFKFHSLLTWDKISPSRTRYYMKDSEFTLYLWKGAARDITNGGDKRITRMARPKGAVHPTQKPVELMAQYIANSSDADDLVLDPFMGSGTTLVAAAKLGRRAVGIEKSPEHFEAACKRVQAAVAEIA